jgi:uncharacterized protein YjeT (DUF2065 family)
MQSSLFIARLIGPITLAIGVALLFNAAAYRAMTEQFLASHALIFLAGLIALAAGLAIVLTHNVWTADWRALITILGWLFVINGIVRTAAPQQAAAFGRRVLGRASALKIGAAIDLILGALFCYFGYLQ